MPVYVFTCRKCGRSVDHYCTVADKPARIACEQVTYDAKNAAVKCGGEMRYDIAATHRTGRDHGDWQETTSTVMGVLASQKAEAEAEAASLGVPTEFRIKGDSAEPVLTSRAHRNALMKALGYGDRDAGYGDYAGR